MYKIEVETGEDGLGPIKVIGNRPELPAYDTEIEAYMDADTEVYATHTDSGHTYRARGLLGPYGIVWMADANAGARMERLIGEMPIQHRNLLNVLMGIAHQLGHEKGWDAGCEHIQSGGGHLKKA